MSLVDGHAALQQRAASIVRKQYLQHCQSKGYEFTTDWFSHNIPVWQHVLRPMMHAPNLHYLEVGSWEGRSACWFIDNVLTHDSARLTCIDTFEGSAEHETRIDTRVRSVCQHFDENVARTGHQARVRRIVGRSQEVLRTLSLDTYDLFYVDGSHHAADVLEDAVLGWRLVKPNGLIVLDDYEWTQFDSSSTEHPKLAIDAFLSVFRDRITVVHRGYQVIVRKSSR